ncbi:CPBP family intramembrane glutamic endopeptidase [Bacillus solimangrovi]|uniref:CAAX prenyl protease 2/Lysostaphin resistance protein A-like domain-containing protein n=1 Tax=Bacillus solimangrovi TaxID=1305675 RepID=A0A1E5LAJ5_9BACI|nr:type II CAAX endopeptidase family protein [Bacillus solimangrovi]OEH91107.1 hypothetical protein BFG57_06975 [Bacillus solimangrovi]
MWFLIIIVGFLLYVVIQLPFQMGFFGGFQGINLTIIGLLLAIFVIPLVYLGLKYLKLDFLKIGFTSNELRQDALLGSAFAIFFTLVQFLWLIPNTGGADRADISDVLIMLEYEWTNTFWYIPLGVIGGALTEEILYRGFFIGGLASIFKGSKISIYIASLLSILFFAAAHLPQDLVQWIDILVPTTAYTILYLYTNRLTASIVAHGLWNILAVILIISIYS